MFTRRFVWRLGITVAVTCLVLMMAVAFVTEVL
jgi:hypothetical protein